MQDNSSSAVDSSKMTALSDFAKPAAICWLIFCAINLPLLTHVIVTVDNEFAANRQSAMIWLQQGRWGTWLFETLIMPEPVVVFFPLALYGLAACFSFLVLLRCARVQSLRLADYLLFAIFCGFPSILLLEAFSVNIMTQGLALLCCSFAALTARDAMFEETTETNLRQTWTMLVVSMSCAVLAISFYQSNLCLLAAAMFVPFFQKAFAQDMQKSVKQVCWIGLYCAAAYLLYMLFNFVFLKALNVPSDPYIERFFAGGEWLKEPLHIIYVLRFEFVRVYGASRQIYGTSGVLLFAFLAFCVVKLGIAICQKSSLKLTNRVFLLALSAMVFCLPFLPTIFAGAHVPVRTLVAVPLCYWLLCFTCLSCVPKLAESRFWLLCLLAADINLVYIHNFNQTQALLAMQRDQSTAEAIIRECFRVEPDFDPSSEQYKLLTYGAPSSVDMGARAMDSTLGASVFEWDGGNPYRHNCYFRTAGLAKLGAPLAADKALYRAQLESMPIWPRSGSVAIKDKMVLVKLGANVSDYWAGTFWDQYKN